MDIWGVENVEAEAELLSAIVFAFTSMGLTASDVGIKINSRKILSELLANAGVPEDKFAPTCVLIDKLEKVPLETLTDDFNKIGLSIDTVNNVVSNLKNRDISEYAKLLGDQSEGVKDIMHLFNLAKSYGYEDWLIFDPSVVRGLAYYTGIVFEGFDRKGQFRAICGGGRYDKLLELFGDEKIPAVGFGFGDAVIVELLRSKNLLPETTYSGVQIVVFSMMESLRPDACSATMKLRDAGYSVDMILSNKKPKWVFQHADRLNAGSFFSYLYSVLYLNFISQFYLNMSINRARYNVC
jgi:histidyl-tRNA synthetase